MKMTIDEICQLALEGRLPQVEGRQKRDDEGLVMVFDKHGNPRWFHYPLSMLKDNQDKSGDENE